MKGSVRRPGSFHSVRLGNPLAFWLGCVGVVAGVVLHLPMFLMGRDRGYVLAGMPMDAGMLWGMLLIVAGMAATAFGLLPRAPAPSSGGPSQFAPRPQGRLGRAHWALGGLLVVALIIDIMKPATLGFVMPGVRKEYSLAARAAAWLPLVALAGTALGSYLWGMLADRFGRRASILLASVMFIGTSICGAMPDFKWNVLMCLLMGLAAGGMLPVVYALLTEIIPLRQRGWFLVLVGGVGAVGGYFAASELSALLQPLFGWRIMWLLGLPTGAILVVLSPLIPESPRFLQLMGREEEMRAELARFSMAPVTALERGTVYPPTEVAAARRRWRRDAMMAALSCAGFAWGLVNLGLLVWIPDSLVAHGATAASASALLARSTLLSVPVIVLCACLYRYWSRKGTLLLFTALMGLGLLAVLAQQGGWGPNSGATVSLALLIVGSCGVIAVLLPYTGESYRASVRGRATGWVAGVSKFGGLLAQGLAVLGVAPVFAVAAGAVAFITFVALVLIVWFCDDTRERDVDEADLLQGPGLAHRPLPAPLRAA